MTETVDEISKIETTIDVSHIDISMIVMEPPQITDDAVSQPPPLQVELSPRLNKIQMKFPEVPDVAMIPHVV